MLPTDCLSRFSVDYKQNLLGTFRYASLVPYKSFPSGPNIEPCETPNIISIHVL